MQILVVEDERKMANLLARALGEEGHQVVVAGDGVEGFEIARSARFDLIVLDGRLPGMDGNAVAHRLRELRNHTPILMLTARDTPADIVRGLDSGADDYLTKPFSLEVLLARVRAVSRRGEIPRLPFLEVGDLRLDPATRRVTRHGELLSLTPREFTLLELLMRNAGRTVTRDTLLDSVWGFGASVNENTLEVFIRQLRTKVDGHGPKLIHTVRGVGYMVEEQHE